MQHIIDQYQLEPHPEGGYFREVHRSGTRVASPAVLADRSAVTHIYFLLLKGQVSRFHRVMHDEIWNFYQGDPIALLQYNGNTLSRETIGPGCNGYALVMNGGIYQAAESTGNYSLVGCTVAPGFDFADFSFLADDPEAASDFNRQHHEYSRFL